MERILKETPITYPLRRIEIKKFSIPASLTSWQSDSLVQSAINPTKLFLMLIPEDLWSGGYKTNPLEFVNRVEDSHGRQIRVQRASLTCNGAPLINHPSGSPEQLLYAAFRAMYNNLGQLGRGQPSCGIHWDLFRNGATVWAYDITRTGRASNNKVRQPVMQGLLRYELSFTQPLPKALNLFCISEHHASFTVDKNRNIVYNFNA